jgi:transposase-like protein
MDVQGVSTRQVKAIAEELCGHSFSASAISRINERLDAELTRFAARALDEARPYRIVAARYEKIYEDGVSRGRAVLLALGIDWGDRQEFGSRSMTMERKEPSHARTQEARITG